MRNRIDIGQGEFWSSHLSPLPCHSVQGFCGTGPQCGKDVTHLHLPSDYEHRPNGWLQICNSMDILSTVQEATVCWLRFLLLDGWGRIGSRECRIIEAFEIYVGYFSVAVSHYHPFLAWSHKFGSVWQSQSSVNLVVVLFGLFACLYCLV
jgi:hypothetical protein